MNGSKILLLTFIFFKNPHFHLTCFRVCDLLSFLPSLAVPFSFRRCCRDLIFILLVTVCTCKAGLRTVGEQKVRWFLLLIGFETDLHGQNGCRCISHGLCLQPEELGGSGNWPVWTQTRCGNKSGFFLKIALYLYLNRCEEGNEEKQVQHDVSDFQPGKICTVNNTVTTAHQFRLHRRTLELGWWRTVWETGSISENDWSAMCAPPNSGPDHGGLSPQFTSLASTEMCHNHMLATGNCNVSRNSAAQSLFLFLMLIRKHAW